ncbi:MAG: hypothetical protein QOH24_1209 [Verrucomicrobiota bacterium]
MRINLGGSGKGPAFHFFAAQDIRDLIGELPIDAAIVFTGKCLALSNGVHMPAACPAITDRKAPRLIGNFINQAPMGISNIESLDQSQTGATGWRFIDFVSFKAAAVSNDDERCRSHRTKVSTSCAIIGQILFVSRWKSTRYFSSRFCAAASGAPAVFAAPVGISKRRFLCDS